MDTNYNSERRTEDFVQDESFINWVLHPDENSNLYWNTYISNHKGEKLMLEEARLIILSMMSVKEPDPTPKLDDILIEILGRSAKKYRKVYINILRYAAILIIFIAVGSGIYVLNQSSSQFPITEKPSYFDEKGVLIMANGKSHEFETRNTMIQQASANKITINDDTIKTSEEVTRQQKKGLNKIIIPYGKRSEITLSDGTHIWLNSGSQLSFPPEFEEHAREVYLTGEAFFDVAENQSKPFFVITPEMKVKVLGTRFNISTYDNDKTVQTVLEKGRVSVRRNNLFSQTFEIDPGERITYKKESKTFEKDRVNVLQYSSWVNGYLIFVNEPTPQVFKKLERLYNQPIVANAGLDTITFSGKLDLKNEIKEVLENISFASSVSIRWENNVYYIEQ